MRKHIYIIVWLLCSSAIAWGQDSNIRGNVQEWYKENKYKGIKVGEKFPDIALGAVVNNKTGKTKFSEFTGKLVVLDFWATSCQGCIAAFPKMEKLQKQFADKIQIFIVNTLESQAEIKERLGGKYDQLMPDLPSIVSAGNLLKLFPYKGVPHHAWIDSDGIVRLIGVGANTNEQKIKDLLEGKEIRFVKGNNVNPEVEEKIPYSKLYKGKPEFFYQSFFSPFNNDYGGSGSFDKVLDTPGLIRKTFVNIEILDMYIRAFGKKLRVNSTYDNFNRFPWLLLKLKDSSLYASEFIRLKTDEWYFNNLYCYEQVTSDSMPELKRQESMLRDLNTYFGNKYGTFGQLKKFVTPCYILTKTATQKITPISNANQFQFIKKRLIENDKPVIYYTGTINRIVYDLINECQLDRVFTARDKDLVPTLYSDEIQSREVFNLKVTDPSQFKSLEDLGIFLRAYGFDLVKENRELEYLVITDRM